MSARTDPAVRPATGSSPGVKQPRLWRVTLLDDDQHTYDYVIRMMVTVFRRTPEEGRLIAERVDREGRAVCIVTHREHAELKRDQIHAFGPDPRIASCAGSMSAVLEPVDGDGDDAGERGGGPGPA